MSRFTSSVVKVGLFIALTLTAAGLLYLRRSPVSLLCEYQVTVENLLPQRDFEARLEKQTEALKADLLRAQKSEQFISRSLAEFRHDASIRKKSFDVKYSRAGDDYYYDLTPMSGQAGPRIRNFTYQGRTIVQVNQTLRVIDGPSLETVGYAPLFLEDGLGHESYRVAGNRKIFDEMGLPKEIVAKEIFDPSPSRTVLGRYLPGFVELHPSGKYIQRAVVGTPESPVYEWTFSDHRKFGSKWYAQRVVRLYHMEVNGKRQPIERTTMVCQSISDRAVRGTPTSAFGRLRDGDPIITVNKENKESLTLFNRFDPTHRQLLRTTPLWQPFVFSAALGVCGLFLSLCVLRVMGRGKGTVGD